MIVGWLEITLVLLGLYLLESTYWLRSGGIAFVTNGRVFRPVVPSNWHSRSGTPRWGPAAPFGLRLITQEWPFAVSPEGIQGGMPLPYADSMGSSHASREVSFAEIERLSSRGATLYVNDLPFAAFQTSRLAAEWAARLREIWKADPEARAGQIRDWIVERLDLHALQDRAAVVRSTLLPLRLLSLGLTAYLLVCVPAFVFRQSFESSWPRLLLGWLALFTVHSVFFVRAHRRLHGRARHEILRNLSLHLCAPITATRAHIHLMQELFVAYDPLAVALALASPEVQRRMLRAVVFAPGSAGPQKNAITGWFHRETLRQLASSLPASTVDLPASLRGPAPDAAVSASYCPRCHSQYVIPSGRCAGCDIGLRRFGDPPDRLPSLGPFLDTSASVGPILEHTAS